MSDESQPIEVEDVEPEDAYRLVKRAMQTEEGQLIIGLERSKMLRTVNDENIRSIRAPEIMQFKFFARVFAAIACVFAAAILIQFVLILIGAIHGR